MLKPISLTKPFGAPQQAGVATGPGQSIRNAILGATLGLAVMAAPLLGAGLANASDLQDLQTVRAEISKGGLVTPSEIAKYVEVLKACTTDKGLIRADCYANAHDFFSSIVLVEPTGPRTPKDWHVFIKDCGDHDALHEFIVRLDQDKDVDWSTLGQG